MDDRAEATPKIATHLDGISGMPWPELVGQRVILI